MRAVLGNDSSQGNILSIATFWILCLATLAAWTAPASAAEPLGRLFFTPAQRSVLDAGKSLGEASTPVTAPRNVVVNGVVTRSDAERTVWINGKAYHDGSPEGLQVRTNPSTPETTEIRVRGREHAARIKVGQQLDLNTGGVADKPSQRVSAESVPVEAPTVPPMQTKESAMVKGPGSPADDKGRTPSAPVSR